MRRRATPHLALLCALSVVPTGLAVAAPAIASGPRTTTPHPVTPTEHHAGLSAVDPAGAALTGALAEPTAAVAEASARSTLAARAGTTMRTAALTPALPVPSGISVVGATWPEGAMPGGARLLVRTATQGVWSAWQALDSDDGHDPDPGTPEAARERGGTQPYVVTDASAVQVRLDSTTGAAPSGASVDVVDPGTSAADASVGTATPGAASAAATQPTIYSRAQWGANESLRRGTVEYGSIQAAFVHHTVSQNNYTAAQVPAIIRGIYAFHVNGRGWNDIGYNFLVDRFGRIWEGRYGGIALPVIGAHTKDYNSNSFAMSAIGDFDIAHVPSAIVTAYTRLFAWKLRLHGIPAIGTVVLNGHTINRISGHRDVGSTACPGRYLYALLPSIRSGTSRLMGTLPRPALGRSLDANATPDLLARSVDGSSALVLPDTTLPVTWSGTVSGKGWDSLDLDVLSPDLTGDHRPDLVVREKATGRLRIYAGDGTGHFPTMTVHGSGWGAMRHILAPGDLDGDGHADLLATNAAGRMYFYPGDGAGWVRTPVLVASTGWQAFSQVGSAGDADGDGQPDLLAVRASTGEGLLYPGLGDGHFAPPRSLGTGWGSTNLLLGAGDLDGDGHLDLVAREVGTGHMRSYFGRGNGTYAARLTWGTGWTGLTTVLGGLDVTGDGHPDLLAIKGGSLVLYSGTGNREYNTTAGTPIDLTGTDHAFVLGDVNHDGRSEVVARQIATGDLVMWDDAGAPGASPTPRRGGGAWSGLNLIGPAGDLTMDGIPDILSRATATGNVYLYPVSSAGIPGRGILLATGMSGMTDIVGVGPNDAGAAPDVVARVGPTGALLLYGGNGPGRLLGPRTLLSSTPDIARLVGSGDVDGDGRSDLVVQGTDGALSLLSGTATSTGGFGTARRLVTNAEAVDRELG
jgi:hypothetical protein